MRLLGLLVDLRPSIAERAVLHRVPVGGFEKEFVSLRRIIDIAEVGTPTAEVAREHDAALIELEGKPRAP